MSKVALVRSDGSPIFVEPNMVDTITEAQAAPPLSFITFTAEGDNTRETVQGTPAAVALLLDAGSGPGAIVAAGGFLPATTIVAGPISLISTASARWTQLANTVQLFCRFDLAFASGSPACAFSFTVPTSPALPFSAGTVRAVVTYTAQPFTGAAADEPASVSEAGTDIRVDLANALGGPKRITLFIEYQTP